MNVILDANLLVADFHLSGKDFRLLWSEASRIPADIFLPRVAFDETVNKYRERLEKQLSVSTKHAKMLGHLLNRDLAPCLPPSSLQRLVLDYESELQSTLTKRRVKVLPYPSVSHQKMVQRDLARMKPFRPGGAGYRDALIWESLVSFCHAHTASTVVFVTLNKRDFGSGPDFAVELATELTDRQIDPQKMQVCCGLDKFNRLFIIPRLEVLPTSTDRLVAIGLPSFDIQRWFAEQGATILEAEDLGLFCLGFEPEHGSVILRSVDQVRKINVLDVRRLTSGEILITAEAELDLVLSVSASGRDWERSDAVREFFGPGGFESAFAYYPSTIRIRVSVFVSTETGGVAAAKLDVIEGDAVTIEAGLSPDADAF